MMFRRNQRSEEGGICSDRRPWLSFLFLLIYSLILFWPIPFAQVTLMGDDILQEFYPWTRFWTAEWETGSYPLWNPNTYGGSPFLANLQIAPYYPPQFLLPLLSPELFFGWTLWLHTLGAGCAMFALANYLTRCRISSLFAGIAYMNCGLLITYIDWGQTTIVNGLPWVPLVLLGYLRWFDRPGLNRWLTLVALIAVQILCGHPQIPYLTLLLTGLIVAWHFFESAARKDWFQAARPLFGFLGAVAIALLLTAFYWIPFHHYNELSAIRSSGATFQYATKDSLPPSQWILMLFPFLFGSPPARAYWGTSIGYHELSGFVGLGTLLMAGVSLKMKSIPRRFLWLAPG